MNLIINSRPQITDYIDAVAFLKDMLTYRRKHEKTFSVMKGCKNLLRTSPTLVSLIVRGQRKLTPDRVEDFAKLLGLTPGEKSFFKSLVFQSAGLNEISAPTTDHPPKSRKHVSTHILSDWLNVYVKDCFHIEEIQKNPDLLYRQLGPLASNKRIKKSLDFLLREGHLRKTSAGHTVIETNLTVTDPNVPSKKIRSFHKAALNIAHQAIDLHSPAERFANTLLVCLNRERYDELLKMTQEFAEKLKDFSEIDSDKNERLYQLLVNLSPTGGRVE